MTAQPAALVALTQARKALALAKTLPEISKIRDVAKAAQAYAQAAHLGTDAVNEAIEVRLRAERKAGEKLSEMDLQQGGSKFRTGTLSDLGISNKESMNWQDIARVPGQRFEDYIQEVRADGHRLSGAGLIREMDRLHRHREREKQAREHPLAAKWAAGGLEPGRVYCADVTDREFLRTLPESSVDMVVTDPPWSEDTLPTFEALGAIACRVLKPGGFCATYTGKMFLPEALHILSQHLDYVWTCGIFQPDSNDKIIRWHLFSAWRPILLLKKPGPLPDLPWIPDAMRCTRSKAHHEWEQGIEPALKLVEAYSVKGELVLDPFVGSGTSLLAAKRAGRTWVGFDIDPDTARLAMRRVTNG